MPDSSTSTPHGRGPVITIDGPAGSGKSTTARMLAARLGFSYLDTGAMYRAAALLGDRLGTHLGDEGQVQALLDRLHLAFAPPHPGDDRPRVLLDGHDVTDAIRDPKIDKLVSPVAAHPLIRRHMAVLQRRFAQDGNVVLEGRDTGTVICPDADVKIYLDANLEERARRRIIQRAEATSEDKLDREEAELDRRDRADRERAVGPLRIPDDAIVIDTSNLTIADQVDQAYRICIDRLRLS